MMLIQYIGAILLVILLFVILRTPVLSRSVIPGTPVSGGTGNPVFLIIWIPISHLREASSGGRRKVMELIIYSIRFIRRF